jgi:quercetin dioxygenase-like cupin family protein
MALADGVVNLQPNENRSPGHVVLKASAGDTRGAYALRENTVSPGFSVQPHRHGSTEEAWYVIDGELTFLVEREVIMVPAGGFALVPRGVTHAFSNRGQVAARFLVVFSPPGLERMFEELLELRASGKSMPELTRAIRARYDTADVEVPPGIWPPS